MRGNQRQPHPASDAHWLREQLDDLADHFRATPAERPTDQQLARLLAGISQPVEPRQRIFDHFTGGEPGDARLYPVDREAPR